MLFVMVYRLIIFKKLVFICMLCLIGSFFISVENKILKMSGGKRFLKKII